MVLKNSFFQSNYLNLGLNTVYQLLSRATSAVTSLIVTRLIIQKIGLEGYGGYQEVIIYLSIFWVFTDFGLNTIAVREMSSHTKKIPEYFFTLTSIRTLLGIAILVISLLILPLLPYPSIVKEAIIFGSLIILLQDLAGCATSIFQVKTKFFYQFLATFLGSLILLIGVYLTLNISTSITALTIVLAASYGVVALVSFWAVFRLINFKVVWDRVLVKNLWFHSAPFGLALVFNYIVYKQDSFLLSILELEKVSNLEAVGIYTLAYKVFELSIVLPGYLLNVLFPILNKQFFEENLQKFYKNVVKTAAFLFLSSLVSLALLFLTAGFWVEIVAGGGEFGSSVGVLKILALSLPASFLLPLLLHLFIVFRKQHLLIVIYGFGWLFNLVANLIFIPKFSYTAAATITVLTEWFLVCLFLVLAYLRLIDRREGD